jgi:hypothetical protein
MNEILWIITSISFLFLMSYLLLIRKIDQQANPKDVKAHKSIT